MDYGLFKLTEGEGKYLIKNNSPPLRKYNLCLMIYLSAFFLLSPFFLVIVSQSRNAIDG